MGRQLLVAATVGAGAGAVVAVLAYGTVTVGMDMYFRVAGWRETRQARRAV